MRNALGLAAVIGLSATGGGCVGIGAGAAAGIGLYAAQERTIGEGIDDASASAELKATLMRMDLKGYSGVDVEVAAGRALLSGAVPTTEHRLAAERAAWAVAAIDDVANEIEVGPSPGIWRSAQDEFITASVRARLLADDQVRALDLNVETHRGVVYLMGIARAPDMIARSAELAARVRGVARVVSFVETRGRAAPVLAADLASPGEAPPAWAMETPPIDSGAQGSGAAVEGGPLSWSVPRDGN